MLLEAFEILQSGGQDENAFVTDFGLYKVLHILTVYLPIILSTFLLSQQYLGELNIANIQAHISGSRDVRCFPHSTGDKVACFAPEHFSEPQAQALNEYCWTNGYWVAFLYNKTYISN